MLKKTYERNKKKAKVANKDSIVSSMSIDDFCSNNKIKVRLTKRNIRKIKKDLKIDLIHPTIGESVNINPQIRIKPNCAVKKEVLEGNNTIGSFNFINTQYIDNVDTGNYVSIAANSAIGIAHDHPTDWLSTSAFQYTDQFGEKLSNNFYSNKKIKIENDVWVGWGVVIKQGSAIPNGCIIACKSFLNKKPEEYSIYGGLPAHKLKNRFQKKIKDKIKKSKWWEYNLSKLDIDYSKPESIDFNGIKKCEKIPDNYYTAADFLKYESLRRKTKRFLIKIYKFFLGSQSSK